VRAVEHTTAEETRASGPQWTFAPCICSAQDDRWGRTYESFSEDPALVERMETAIDGFQGAPGHLADRDRVLATAKHFAGDGDTKYGTAAGDYKIDQGVAVTNHQDFYDKALRQYVPAVQDHHVGSAMPSFSRKFELGLFEHPYTDRTNIGDIGSASHHALARRAAAESQVLLKNDGAALPYPQRANVYVAGSNADNIGNQAGGWTLTWQGGSTNVIPGTTILDGIREDTNGRVTYSADASKPINRNDLGVVVVGETPYAEGFGDVGGPLWAYDPGDNGVPRPVKDMQLSAADKAAVDKVCAAASKCAVVVVSGRPLILDSAQRDAADALVAAWLPGSEGAGVADTLFGVRPFTGRLPMSWPRSLAQEPINKGDANYDPLYRFGYGLTTN